jgi:hypothetical protein
MVGERRAVRVERGPQRVDGVVRRQAVAAMFCQRTHQQRKADPHPNESAGQRVRRCMRTFETDARGSQHVVEAGEQFGQSVTPGTYHGCGPVEISG